MRHIIHTVLIVLLFIMSVVLLNLGVDYINPDIGYGISPWIAFPWAIINMVIIYKITAPAKPWTKP